MKSHPCVKTPGGGVLHAPDPNSQSAPSQPVTSIAATNSSDPVTLTPCRHINRRGHRCRLFSTIPNLELCPHHARLLEKQHQRHNDASADELLSGVEDFSNPAEVNTLLGNLVRQLARKRIARLDAIAIAYVSQLLLGSIAALDRRDALVERAAGNDDLPPRIVFDPPDPIPDTARIAAHYSNARTPEPQITEGRT